MADTIRRAKAADWTIKLEDEELRSAQAYVGHADDLHAALDAAWLLQRSYESPVVIYDNRDGEPRRCARVNVEWLDD